MTTSEDFLSALQTGREAATEADANRAEIQAVLDEMAEQLKRLLPEIELGRVHKTRGPQPGEIVFPTLGLPTLGRPYQVLVVQKGSEERELCDFEEGPMGYPVELRYPNRIVSAGDRESLINALKFLLTRPHVGRIFNELLNASGAAPKVPAAANGE